MEVQVRDGEHGSIPIHDGCIRCCMRLRRSIRVVGCADGLGFCLLPVLEVYILYLMKWRWFGRREWWCDVLTGDRRCASVKDCRRCNIYVGVTTIFKVVLVIQNVVQASSSWERITDPMDPVRVGSFYNIIGLLCVGVGSIVIVSGVNDVGDEDVVIVINDVNEVVSIGTGEGDEAGVDEGASVAVVGGVRVLAFEVGALFVSGVVVHVQVRKCFPKLHQKVAGVGMVICLAASPAFPLER